MDVNILLFNDFQALDAFGPIEILGRIKEYKLHFCSLDGGTVVSAQGTPVLTENIKASVRNGILVIPGGMGTRRLVDEPSFIDMLKDAAEQSHICLSICTGSALLAKTGLLDGRKATSNKIAFGWVVSLNSRVNWIRKARWVTDGKYYTASGVSAGMDMTLGFLKDTFGERKAEEVARDMEYIWNSDPTNDMFA